MVLGYWTENMSSTVCSWKGYQVNPNPGVLHGHQNPKGKLQNLLRVELQLQLSEEEYEKFPEALMSRMTRTNRSVTFSDSAVADICTHDKMSCVSRPFVWFKRIASAVSCFFAQTPPANRIDLGFQTARNT